MSWRPMESWAALTFLWLLVLAICVRQLKGGLTLLGLAAATVCLAGLFVAVCGFLVAGRQVSS